MKNYISIIVFSILGFGSYSQVGIGTLTPDKSATLDVVAENKGILIPRVGLQNIFDSVTVSGSVDGRYQNSLLVFNTSSNTEIAPGYYYWFDDRWNRFLNQEDILQLAPSVTVVSLTVNEGNLILEDSEGNVTMIPIIDLNIITTLVDNEDGTYTYTSESGVETIIDVPSDVQNNFQQIVNNTNVKNILENIILNTKNVVKYDGSNFSYIDVEGNTQVVNMQQIVQNFQTTTTLENGENTQVVSNVDATNPNNTIWKVNVNTARGAQNNSASTLGVVKEKAENPLITISQSGELQLNLETINHIKEINSNYNVLSNDAILLGDASSNNVNITLPDAQNNKGKRLIIKKDDSNEDFYITVLGTIHGVQNSLYTALPYSGWEFVSDGAQWRIINKF